MKSYIYSTITSTLTIVSILSTVQLCIPSKLQRYRNDVRFIHVSSHTEGLTENRERVLSCVVA